MATAFVLLAVFLPVSFMGGATGVLYKQFALTIVVALSLSAVVAMSLSPAVSALVIKPKKDLKKASGPIGKLFDVFNRALDWATEKYVGLSKKLLRHYKVGLAGMLVVFCLIGFFFKMIPTAYVPDEDQSFMLVSASLPAAASTNRSMAFTESFGAKIAEIPGVRHVMQIIGIDILSSTRQPNGVLIPVKLNDIGEREGKNGQSVQEIINKVAALGADAPEATVRAFNMAVLPGMSNTGNLSLYIMDTVGKDTSEMTQDVGKLLGLINQRPEVGMAYTTFSDNTPSIEFHLDREKAESLNIPVSNVTTALQANLGGSEVNDFNLLGKTWKVVIQADKKYRADTKQLSNIFVKNTSGDLIPLSAVVTSQEIQAPPVITRFNNARGAKIAGSPATGYSTGDAMSAIDEVLKQNLPSGYTYEWVDQSRDERDAGSSSYMIFAVSLIFVYLCLSALYESWSLPLGIIFGVPTAVMGCVGFQYLRGLSADIYMQIGMIVLIGLSAKNSILIVEYAKMRVDNGRAILPALIDTVKVRLRPILMTAFSTVIGAVPLAWASGAGAGSRISIGTAIIGGMMSSTLLSIFLVPVLFLVIEMIFHPDIPVGSVDDE